MNNPHIENAIHTIGQAAMPNVEWESADAYRIALQIEANTRASLALSYAQDTANLIAAFGDDALGSVGVHCIDYPKLADQIKERLNLA